MIGDPFVNKTLKSLAAMKRIYIKSKTMNHIMTPKVIGFGFKLNMILTLRSDGNYLEPIFFQLKKMDFVNGVNGLIVAG